MKGVLFRRYVCRRIRMQATPELARTWAEVRAPSPPLPPVADWVNFCLRSSPAYEVVGGLVHSWYGSQGDVLRQRVQHIPALTQHL